MAVVPTNKDLRQLVARLKQGYKLEETGRQHFRILDRNDEPVTLENGKQLVVPNTPRTGGHALKNIEAELERARVLRGTEQRISETTKTRRKDTLSESIKLRSENRQAQAKKLFTALDDVLQPFGGLHHPQMNRDLGSIGAMIARESGEEGITPDLAAGSALQVARGAWVTPRYARLWEELISRLQKSKDPVTTFFTLVRQARGIPDETVHVGKPVEGDWPFRVELLPIEAFLVDHSYQRPVAWPFVRRNAARFDESLVGTIDVSERRRGAVFAILDGQLRFEMCRMVSKKTIWASIYSGLDLASEARFFLHKNKDKKAVHPYYTLRARSAAQDPVAIAIDQIVGKYGYELAITAPRPDTNVEKNIAAIAAVEQAFLTKDVESNKECLSPTLSVLQRSTLGRLNGQNGVLIRGLANLFARWPLLDDDHLAQVVAMRGPDFLLGKSREGRYGGGSSGAWMARTLRDEYNRGLTRETQLRGEL